MTIRRINAHEIYDAVKEMILNVSTNLPKDVYDALAAARKNETHDSAKVILGQLLSNADLASRTKLPLCQDTGVAVFFVKRGEDVHIEGDSLSAILNAAMVDAYEEGLLRKSLCHPLTRANSGDNSPAIIHTDIVEGDGLTIKFMAKGGGSENMSRCTMLTPAQGWDGIKEFVVNRMAKAGPNPCPPTIIGIGIGGTFDLAPSLAKKALFRPVGIRNADPEVAAMEEELLAEVNSLGIGPMGLGGATTTLDVKIEMHPCHIASLPVAINVQCHSARSSEVKL